MKLRNFGYISILLFSITACSVAEPHMPVMHSFAEVPSSPSLTVLDLSLAERTAQNALEYNIVETSSWSNPETGHSGTFTPTETFRSEDGRKCRNFQMAIYTPGLTEKTTVVTTNMAEDIACQNSSGLWAYLMEPHATN